MREVADARKARQRRAIEEGDRLDSMCDGDERVVVAPEERQGRKRRGILNAIEEMPVLSPPVDDVADAPRERARRARARVVTGEPLDLVGRERATGRVKRPRRPQRHERLPEPLDEEWKRRPPERDAHLATETPRRLEAEPANAPPILNEHPPRHPASKPLPHDVAPLH